MVIGFILISTAPAKEHDVFKTLMNVSEIVELHPLFGEYDLIAKIEARDFNTLGQIVVEKVRSIPGVIDTKTLTGIKFSCNGSSTDPPERGTHGKAHDCIQTAFDHRRPVVIVSVDRAAKPCLRKPGIQ